MITARAQVQRDTPEWRSMWAALSDSGEDIDAETEGERWQYMGSSLDDGVWLHGFRHRCHPRVVLRVGDLEIPGRKYLSVTASPDWQPDEAIPVRPINEDGIPF